MANNNTKDLIPSYVESDFLTALTKNTELMKASETFKDYNYHGANMTMILELLSYLADFSSFHTNMVAKNVYMDSASVYETVHSLAQQKGYNARGYVSPYVAITVELSGGFVEGEDIIVDPWQQMNTGLQTQNGEHIYYTITDEYTHTVGATGETTSFTIYMRQGTIDIQSYDGDDMIDNNIILPFKNYDHGTYPFSIPAIDVVVVDETWERTNDFYDKLSGLIDLRGAYDRDTYGYADVDDVFMFKYDKYKRYVLQFDTSRNVPKDHEDIYVNLLVSLGSEGGLRQNAITIDNIGNVIDTNGVQTGLLIHRADTPHINMSLKDVIKFTNVDSSVGGSNPETIEEIKIGARSNVHSQYRNITGRDYRYHLEARSDVVRGLAWGEQEIDPGNVLEYNKTYLSVIPSAGTFIDTDEDGVDDNILIPHLFSTGTINTIFDTWSWTEVLSTKTVVHSAPIEICDTYDDEFEKDLLRYLEPRKMLNNYEVPVLPNIVYFRFDIGVRPRRTYAFSEVVMDVRDKLSFFFDPSNRLFNEEISFMDIHNFILDLSITSDDNDFKNIAGVDNLVLRDLGTYTTLNEGEEQVINEPVLPPERGKFPQYKYGEHEGYTDNKLRPILLDYNQFPMVVIDMCRFTKEK